MQLLIATIFSRIYSSSVVILFVFLTRLASWRIQGIIDDVHFCLLTSCFSIKVHLLKWKQSYRLISLFVSEIDSFFGPILVVHFVRLFYVFIFLPFTLSEPGMLAPEFLPQTIGFTLRIFHDFMNLSLMVSSTVAIKGKVNPPLNQFQSILLILSMNNLQQVSDLVNELTFGPFPDIVIQSEVCI